MVNRKSQVALALLFGESWSMFKTLSVRSCYLKLMVFDYESKEKGSKSQKSHSMSQDWERNG